MRTLVQLAWATLERAFPRVASAVVMVAFAAYTAPASVGIYSWVALTFTLYQAVAENALRNQAVLAVEHPRHVRSVRVSATQAAVVGSVAIAGTLAWLWYTYSGELAGEILGLTPFLVVPFITTAGIVPVARLQFRAEWGRLARYQLIAALCGLSLSFTVVVVTHSSLAMAVHLLTTEAVFWYLVRRRSGQLFIETREGGRHPRKGMGSLITLGTLGWAQGQLERVFVGGLAGVGVLGTYSTAVTMGRSPGEALAAATANYLRASVSAEPNARRHPRLVSRITLLAAGSATLSVALVVLLVRFLLEPLLGASWQATLEAVPTLAVATIPYSVSVALQIMSIYHDRSRASIVPAVLGVLCAPVIGWLAVSSVHTAACMVIAKELMILVVCHLLARIKGAGASVAAACALTLAALAMVELVL